MKKILILLANPSDTSQLRLNQEVSEIQKTLRQSNHRDEFEIIPVGAVQVDDLQQTLYDYNPTIVHFSGHGAGKDGLVLEDSSGRSVLVSEDALARLFKAFQTQIECVILNACYSEIQANAIHQHIDCVVGMNQAIGDQAAIKFAVGFYRALGAGEPYENCFESGRTLIDLNGIPEVDKPQIKYRNRTKNAAMSSNPESNKTMPSPQENAPSQNKSQTLSNITIGGTNNPSNLINDASGNVKIDQSHRTQTMGQNSNLEVALTELEKLKQAIVTTNSLNSIQKKQAEFPVEMIETELKKPQPDKSLINEAVEALKKGLEGVETLAEPVMKVAKILATVFI
ncbi:MULTISPECIES: CHAT domain-containing protein [Planktothrix]|nr:MULTISPECIES: CHAT domain-containing protein [Planktothrix]